MRSLPFWLPLTLGLVACSPWYDDEQYALPVFSEDGEGIAAVYLAFEAQEAFAHTRTRAFQTQVLMKEDTSASTPAAISPMLPGQAQDLFFMREAGYIVLGRWSDAVERTDGSSERQIWYDHITLDGTVTLIDGGSSYLTMLSCDGGQSASSTARPLRVIPNPSGTVLAKFEATTTCDSRLMQVTFLQASDLSVLEGPHEIADMPPTVFDGESVLKPIDLGWLSDDEFAVGFWGTGSAPDAVMATTRIVGDPVAGSMEVPWSCFFPPTSSSESNGDGERVFIDGQSGNIWLEDAGPSGPGCAR